MAFKFTVDYTRLRVIIDTDSLEPVSVFQNLQAVITHTELQSSLQYVNLSAVNVFLDPDSKNLYFLSGHPNAETISLTDVPAILFETARTETVTLSEEATLAFSKSASDTVGISESISKVVDYVRAFSDAPSLSDDPAIAFSTSFDDSSTLSDAPALSIEPAKSDTLSFLDSEVLSVDPAKSDTLSVSDSPAFSVDLPQSDTTTVSEAKALGVGKTVPPGGGTFVVTVASGTNSYGSGNKYYIDGVVSPSLTLEIGETYRFDVSDSSVGSHPFRFSETANGTHGGGSAYTTNVTVSGSTGTSGAYVEIQVTASTPSSLHYYCTNHSGMGADITVQTSESVVMSEVFSRVATFSRSFSDSYTLDDTASPSDELRTDVNINKGNIVSLGDSAPVFSVSTSFSDSPSITESLAYSFSTTFSDSITISESLQSDALGLYSDSASLSESHAVAFGLTIPTDANVLESVSISESLVDSFGKSLSDSATITESISVVLVAGATANVLNTQALNTSVLN